MRVRVVSLVPSMTETLVAWGVPPVACTRFCERPELAHVGGTKDPDIAAIVALAPDLVVVDTEENRRDDHDALVAAGLRVWALHIRSMADVGEQLEPLAEHLGLQWRMKPPADVRPAVRTAFVPIWRRPWMALGTPTCGADVLRRLGVATVPTGAGPYPAVTLDTVADLRPDLVLAPSEPYPFGERHRAELAQVAPVQFVDGKDLFWWGVRTPGALDRLGRVLDALS